MNAGPAWDAGLPDQASAGSAPHPVVAAQGPIVPTRRFCTAAASDVAASGMAGSAFARAAPGPIALPSGCAGVAAAFTGAVGHPARGTEGEVAPRARRPLSAATAALASGRQPEEVPCVAARRAATLAQGRRAAVEASPAGLRPYLEDAPSLGPPRAGAGAAEVVGG